jgi:hypothetical protein
MSASPSSAAIRPAMTASRCAPRRCFSPAAKAWCSAGPCYRADSKQYHLDADAARKLVAMVVKEYRDQHSDQPPTELFLHAKSSFTDEEWKGFKSGAPPKTIIVGVQIADARDNLKLFRPRNYPILRGSALLLGDDQALLWTAGCVPRLDTYLGPETPNPILIRRQRGDCAFDAILRDVMGPTKINFNSCLHNDRLPITIRFATPSAKSCWRPLRPASPPAVQVLHLKFGLSPPTSDTRSLRGAFAWLR